MAGTAPMEYVRRQRIRRAQSLLICSDLTVKGIAAQCGFDDMFYFIRAFKESTGQSPTEYRRTVRLPHA